MPDAPGAPPAILIVDDDALLRRMLTRSLGRRGFRTYECGNGAEAIAFLESATERVAAIVLDLMMPVMDGFATLEALARFHPPYPVLVISGGNDGRDALDPALPFLAKPFAPSEFLARLEPLLANNPTSQS